MTDRKKPEADRDDQAAEPETGEGGGNAHTEVRPRPEEETGKGERSRPRPRSKVLPEEVRDDPPDEDDPFNDVPV